MPSLRPPHRQHGFTLIEMAVTVSVLGLLLAAAAPSITDWLRNSRIRSVATSVQTGLQKARMEAIRRNQPVRFSLVTDACALSNGGVAWVVSLNDPSGKCAETNKDADPMIIDKSSSAIGSSTVVVAADSDSVSFNGFGQVTGAAPITTIGIDNVADGNNYRDLRIAVGSGGTVRMCDPNVTDTTDPRKC
jgi:type IV fimbrial biogenesis protein FimT